ncbi:hypothetical protein [Candidatus Lariskella endosymbiont of Hedychridium roseum]|uniref:flagellin N-terminal helical domain-containing protein n=1 Tax=Candidatus Lariskella endosymbiont of Hedychridium roseum TaxID=3077949 RepID=UPI0030CA7E2A
MTGNLADERKDISMRLITGKRASPAEDPAKDSLASQMDVNQSRLQVARDSIDAGSAILGIAEKGAQIVLEMAQKMEETRAKSASGEISDKERVLLDQHFQSFKAQFERTVANTKYGDKNLLDGSLSAGSTVETNTVGIEPGATAESTMSYEMPKVDLTELSLNGVKIRIDKGATAGTPRSFFKQQTETISLSLKDVAPNLITATAASAIKIAGVEFKLLNGGAAAPTAKAYEIDMAGKSSAVDIANALANAINTADRATLTGLAGVEASVSGGVLSIKKVVNSATDGGTAPTFDVEMTSVVATELGANLVSSVRQGGTPMNYTPVGGTAAKFTTRQIIDGDEYFVVGGDVALADGTGRESAANDIANLIQNANGSPIVQSQLTRDLLGALSATVLFTPETTAGQDDSVTTMKLSSKMSGIAGAFSLIERSPGSAVKTESSVFSSDAKVGSLGLSNTSAGGSISTDAILQGLGTSIADSGFVDISKDLLVDGTEIKIGGRTYVLKENISGLQNAIQVKKLDPLQTLNNIATFLNTQADPSVANFNYEVNGDKTKDISQLRFFARVPDDAVNSVQMSISNKSVTNKALLTLSGGDAGGIDTAKVTNNPSFVGRVQGFTVTSVTNNEVKLQLSVGGIKYEGLIKDTTLPKDTRVIMQSSEGGSFSINLKAGKGMVVESNNKEAEAAFAKKFDEAFSQVKFYQAREIDSFKPAEGSLVDRTIAEFIAADYKKGADIEKIEVTGSDKTGKASIVLSLKDGRKYRSVDFGNSIEESEKIDLIKFQDPIEGQNVDSNEKISMHFGRSVNLTDPHATKQFQADIIAAFKATSSPLQFQAGTEVGDKISVSISGFDYHDLFADKEFNVQTAANAERLAEVMDEIIAKAITVNAEIGAAMNSFQQVAKSLQAQTLGLIPISDVLGKVDMLEQLAAFNQNSTQMDIAVNSMAETDRYSRTLMQRLFTFQ